MRAMMSFVRDGKLRSCVNLREQARHGFQFDT
jgi:hypothetical protein